MKKLETILFFGNERLATGVSTDLPILKALVSNGYNVSAVVTSPGIYSPSRKVRDNEVADFARANNIRLLELAKLKPAVDEIKSFKAELGVLASFGRIVPQVVIDLFPSGIINVHPSLLPLHRGPIPIEGSILGGDAKSGVSLMQLVAEMDAGPIYDQQVVELRGNESKQELADLFGKIGAKRLIELLPQILSGKISPKAQQGSPTYDKRLEASDGILDYKLPSVRLERQIRAFLGWPRSKTVIARTPVILTQAHASPEGGVAPGVFADRGGELVVGTADGLLVIDRLIPAGSKEMSGADYLRGHPLS